MEKAVYLKHITVIKEDPKKLEGKTIKEVFYIDQHSFFFKDEKGKIYYYTTFLTSENVMPGIELETKWEWDKERKRQYPKSYKLYLYPSVYSFTETNLFKEYEKSEGKSDSNEKRYAWVKGAFEFGIFNKHIKTEYLTKLKADYKDMLENRVRDYEKMLENAKLDLKKYESNS